MKRFFFLALIQLSCSSAPTKPSGCYLGLLVVHNKTYHLYLDYTKAVPTLHNVTFKAEQMELGTLRLTDDSLHFRLKEYYSEFNGRLDAASQSIIGNWIDYDSSKYPLVFRLARPDTVSGLHPRTSRYYAYEKPKQLSDDIQVGSLEEKMSSNSIDSVVSQLINGKYQDVHSLLIARNNELVVEEYFYRFNRDKVYNIQSATKSVVSALTGIAIWKGEITGVSQTLCASHTPYSSQACDEKHRGITLHQLLSMSTGITWDEVTYDYGDPRNSATIADTAKDQLVHMLSLPLPKHVEPIFTYNSLNHLMMNVVLKQATGMGNQEELETRLLKPLGITNINLGEPTNTGVIGDIGLRPRDMLKFGVLYMNMGRWKGHQIVPQSWVQESTTTKIQVKPGLGYAYFWWTKNFQWRGKTISSYFAWGYGGQYIFVVPELSLVVVLSGSHWDTNPEGQGVAIMEEILAGIL